MFKRAINISQLASDKSCFLFGPRQTGKTTLLRTELPQAAYLNLLDSALFRRMSRAPETLSMEYPNDASLIIIDEVQRLPIILNEVQLLLDQNPKLRFVLTGSSAAKLKRSQTNLLGGRARSYRLHPLCSSELPLSDEHPLDDRLSFGSLPSITLSQNPFEDLAAYVGLYLQEEIRAESLVRSIEAFSRFIEVAAFSNGEQVNFTKVGNDAEVPARTVREYFRLLEETLVGYLLEPLRGTRKRKAVATPKFYFFDMGVSQFLSGKRSIGLTHQERGRALEHFIFLELRTFLDYHAIHLPLNYWRSQSQLEVDFVIGKEIAIEVKNTTRHTHSDLKGLRALQEDIPLKKRVLVCNEAYAFELEDGIEILPVADFCRRLWEGKLVPAPQRF